MHFWEFIFGAMLNYVFDEFSGIIQLQFSTFGYCFSCEIVTFYLVKCQKFFLIFKITNKEKNSFAMHAMEKVTFIVLILMLQPSENYGQEKECAGRPLGKWKIKLSGPVQLPNYLKFPL